MTLDACDRTDAAGRRSSRCLAAKGLSAVAGVARATQHYVVLSAAVPASAAHAQRCRVSGGTANTVTIHTMSLSERRSRRECADRFLYLAKYEYQSERTMRPWPADAAVSARASASRAARCLCLGGGCGRRSSQSRTPRRASCCVPVPSACTGYRSQAPHHATLALNCSNTAGNTACHLAGLFAALS